MSKGTARRTIRIDDGLWEQAKEKAAENDQDLSEIIRAALRAYIEAE